MPTLPVIGWTQRRKGVVLFKVIPISPRPTIVQTSITISPIPEDICIRARPTGVTLELISEIPNWGSCTDEVQSWFPVWLSLIEMSVLQASVPFFDLLVWFCLFEFCYSPLEAQLLLLLRLSQLLSFFYWLVCLSLGELDYSFWAQVS